MSRIGSPGVRTLAARLVRQEERWQRRCDGWAAPYWVRLWMVWATRAGDGGLWAAVLVMVLCWGGPERWRAVLAMALAMASGLVVFLGLKRLAGRPRPCARQQHRWARVAPPDPFSFPSGHTLTAFAAAVPLLQVYPELTFGLLFCAVSIGASRILLGMHYLSDVVAGGVLGAGLGWLAVSWVR